MLLTAEYFKKIPRLLGQIGVLIWFLIPVINTPCFAQDYLPFKAIIQVESNISDGVYSPLELLNLAREKGIKIVIFTESFLRRWEYGIWPLENLIKRKYEEPSLTTYGIKRYLKKIDSLNQEFQDMVILGAAEVTPFYWWEGNPFESKIFNFGWGKHLLVIGLDSKGYEYLPVLSKRHILPQNLKDFISLLVPIFLIFLGGILLKLKIQRRILYQNFSFKFPLFSYRPLGCIIIFLGIVCLMGNFPFLSRYDAYHGDRGYKPYQQFIDYVGKRGGFVSWAHPGMGYSRSLGGRVDIISLKYFDVLTNTFDYNAFAGLYNGDVSACFVDKEWDTVLKEFCLNKRKNPVWATGEVDYDGKAPRQRIDEIQTVFLLRQLNKDSVFEALKKGRFYARRYSDDFNIDLEEFSLEDRIMGETAKVKAQPKLIIKGNAHIQPEAEIKLEIIRSGKVAQIYEIKQGRFDLEFIDNGFIDTAKKNYYRLNFFWEEKLILISNPIFCEVS